MQKNTLGNNIQALRTAYGETLEELGNAVGVSRSTISEYESGSRGKVPPREILIKIAKHYRVTLDDLTDGDLSGYRLLKSGISYESLSSLNKIIFPIIVSDKAMEDPDFARAYRLHNNILEAWSRGFNAEDAMDECIKAYEVAYKKGILEANANSLWWIIRLGCSFSEAYMFDGYEDLYNHRTTFNTFLKHSYLYSYEEGLEHYPTENELAALKDFIEENEDELRLHLNTLKASKEYSDLADYYLALQYSFGIINNNRSKEMNAIIGGEMLVSFAKMNNKYALEYIVSLGEAYHVI